MRRKILRRLLTVLACLSILAGQAAFALPNPTQEFYVADYARLLSQETRRFVLEHSAALAEQTQAQVVVATVESLEGRDVLDYGLEILRSWGVGSREKNNGAVILVSSGDRKIGISVGYGLEGALNDAKVGRLLDNCAIPYLKEGDYDTGIYQFYNAVLSEVYREYGLSAPENVRSLESYENENRDLPAEAAVVIVVLLIIILLTVLSNHRGWPPGGGSYRRRGSFYGRGFGSYGGFGGSSGGSFGGFGGFGGSGGGGGASRGF